MAEHPSKFSGLLGFVINRPLLHWIVVYCASLLWIYHDLVVTQLSHEAFAALDHSVPSWILRFALVFPPLLFIPKNSSALSTLTLWLMYVVLYIPGQLFTGHMVEFDFGQPLFFRILLAISFCATCVIASSGVAVHAGRTSTPSRLELSPNSYWMLLTAATFVTYAVVFFSYGLHIRAIALDDVYEVRGDFVQSSKMNGVLGVYCVFWASKVINPTLMFVGIASRRYFFLVAGVIGQLAIFSVAAFKESLGLMVLVPTLWAIEHFGLKRHFGKIFTAGFSAVFLACYAFDKLAAQPMPLMTIVLTRRLVYVPSKLTSYYADFFSDNPPYLLSHGVMKWFIDCPYDLRPPFLLGQYYMNNGQISLNANYMADGIANFGWIGMLGSSLLFGVLLRFLDTAIKSGGGAKIGILLLAPIFSLTNSALLTCLVSHGIGPAILLLATMPAEVLEAKPRRNGGRVRI